MVSEPSTHDLQRIVKAKVRSYLEIYGSIDMFTFPLPLINVLLGHILKMTLLKGYFKKQKTSNKRNWIIWT